MRIHPSIVKQTVLSSLSETQLYAQSLLAQYDWRHTMIELRGDLGAGKTTFARALIHALGVTEHVKSPTYGILETYTGQGVLGNWWHQLAISHFDFYRLSDPMEWEEAGFRDIFAAPGLKLVEWADKAGPLLPTPDVVLALALQDDQSRLVTLTLNPTRTF